jgi:hypothetical protein
MGRRVTSLSLAIILIAAVSLTVSPAKTRPLFLALLLSSFAMYYLSANAQVFTVPLRRVLADLALLMPLLVLPIR